MFFGLISGTGHVRGCVVSGVVFLMIETDVFANTLTFFMTGRGVFGRVWTSVCKFFWYGVLSFVEGHLCANFSGDWRCCVGGCISLVCRLLWQ